jgi:outer membrane protein assembly factor BamB
VGETVVVGSCNGFIHGLDKATGRARWKYDAGPDGGRPEFHGVPLVVGDLVVLSSDDRHPSGVGHVYAIEASSGAVRWKTRIGRGSMTDVVRLDTRLYTVTLDGELVALDLADGKQVWSSRGGSPLDHEILNVVATPAIDSGRIFFAGADGVVHALSATSGAPVWKSEIGSAVSTALVVVSDALCFGTRDGRLLRIDRGTGKLLAELRLGRIPFGPLVAAGESLFTFAGENDLLVLDAVHASLGRSRWTRRAERGWSSAGPYLWKGAVVAGGEGGELEALRPEDGAVTWTRHVDGVVRGVGSDGDLLFIGTLKGAVFAVRPPGEPASAAEGTTQAPQDAWSPVRFMAGEWAGESEGQPGRGTVKRGYRFVLGDKFLHEQNISTYPAQPKNEKGEVHEHWSFFSLDRARRALVLRQFHQEGFVNQYVMLPTTAGGKLVFESETFENVPATWKARETYEVISPDEFIETFELSQGEKPYEAYSRTRFKRVPGR